ncbi:MAG: pitrilysin family protein [bacterium]|nr:pitrilysin family protein [bacterium]
MTVRLSSALFICLFILTLSGCSQTNTIVFEKPIPGEEVYRYQLQNGLKVILQPVHSTPVVAMNVWVHVGAKNEDSDTRGIVHVHEHMAFQGTDSFPEGEIFSLVEGLGGDLNAFTDFDTTVYFITLPSRGLNQGLEILSSMVQESNFPEESLKNELQVILEEYRAAQDQPVDILRNAFLKEVFSVHPYREPILGTEESIPSITRDQVVAFNKKWYVPSNMSLVLVGDFDPDQVIAQIQKFFGDAPFHPVPERSVPQEPPQTEMKSIILQKPFDSTFMGFAFQAPGLSDPETPVLDVLLSLVGTGRSSRLIQKIREQAQLVQSIQTIPFTPEDPGLSAVLAQLKPEDIEEAFRATLREFYLLKYVPVPDHELEKARLLSASGFIYGKESYSGLAGKLGSFETTGGGLENEPFYLNRIQTTSARDIMDYALKYFQNDALSVGIMYPESLPVSELITQDRIKEIAESVEADLQVQYGFSDEIASQEYFVDSGVTNVHFQNGMTLLVREDPSVETVGISAVFLGGLRFENDENAGTSAFLAELMTRGTQSRDQIQIAEEIESIAGGLSGFSGRNSFGLNANSLSRYSPEMLSIVSDLIRNSSFPKDQVEAVRKLVVGALEDDESNAIQLALDAFTSMLYGDHPYHFNTFGTLTNAQSFTSEDFQDFSLQYVVPQNLVLSVVGDVSTEDVIRSVAQGLGDWEGPDQFVEPVPAAPAFPSQSQERRIHVVKEQTNTFLGFKGITLDSPDRYAFQVADKILSGTSGRLFSTLRDQEGLAYTVTGFSVEGFREPGFYVVYIANEPSKTEQAIEGIKREIQKLIDDGVSDEELEKTKRLVTGNFVIGLQTFKSQASALATSERYGMGFDDYLKFEDSINAVTKEDVQRVAQKYFTLDESILTSVGPQNPQE